MSVLLLPRPRGSRGRMVEDCMRLGAFNACECHNERHYFLRRRGMWRLAQKSSFAINTLSTSEDCGLP